MKKQWVGLIAITLLIIGVRLFFAFQTPFYSSDAAYLHLRYTESITQGKLLTQDPLGYGGRTLLLSPIFDIILALFSLIIPLAPKIIPNILASLLIIPAYLISYRITKSVTLSIVTAIIANIVPAYIGNTFNHISTLTIAIPLFFTIAYLWLMIPEYTLLFLSFLLLLAFLHPLSIILVLSIGIYIILCKIEGFKTTRAEHELSLFALFFALWSQFLLYKKLILFHGTRVIWQNIPKGMLSAYYSSITILGALWQIGIFPRVGGIYALYKTVKQPQKETHLLLSIATITTIMLWFKIIDLKTGLMLLGITLSLLFAKAIILLNEFVTQTRLAKHSSKIILLTCILAIIFTAIPAYTSIQDELKRTITQEEITALKWLKEISPENSIIIAPPAYGNYITAIAERKNVMDEYFFLQPRINERYQDITRLYKTSLETEAVQLFDKYEADYLVVPPGKRDVKYQNSKCFKRIKATNILIYEKDQTCKIKVVS